MLLFLLATWPQLLSLERFPVVAQLTAHRGLLVVISVAGALSFAVLAWRSALWRRRATLLTACLMLVAATNSWIMTQRGFAVTFESEGATDLTVFVWNVFRDGPDPSLIADFATANEVDVIVLLEVSQLTADFVAEKVGQAGRPMQPFTLSFHDPESPRYTALLVSDALGTYTQDHSVGSTARVPSVVARPEDGSGPTLVAGHAAPPFPGLMARWNSGLRWLAERCAEDNIVVMGDFNATLDHFSSLSSQDTHVGDCRDAAHSLGGGALGTWPSFLPMFLGSPIDHVVASSDWKFSGYRVVTELDGQGSDHRALLVRLQHVR